MEVFTELIKMLSEDAHLLENKKEFLDLIGISEAIVGPWLKLFDMGHCRPYDLIRAMLSEWVVVKKDSATVAELRRALGVDRFLKLSDKLDGLQKMHPGPIKIPELEASRRNDPLGVNLQAHSSGNPPPMETTKRPMTFGLKSVVQNFTGREEELGRLNQYFQSKECPIVLISGLGGIGKTELAKKFALDISDRSVNGQIVKSWLSGENPQTLLNSTAKFCDQLQLPSKGADGQPLPIQEMIQNIMAKLKSSGEFGRWVIIIDNVDQIHPEFETALETFSEFSPDAFLIVTSRRTDIFPGDLELLEVATMQLQDSMDFVRKSLKITVDLSEVAIKSLCLQLDNLPLALNQATAFIRQQQTVTLKRGAYTIQNYLDELAKNQKLGLDKDRRFGYSTATLAVWNITIDRIRKDYGAEGQIAMDLLCAMAFINPDAIPIQLMHKLYQRFYSIEEIDVIQIESSLTLLQNYSLTSSYDEVLSIHRLVQLALRDRMSSKSSAEDGEFSKDVEMLTKFWTSFDYEEFNQIEMRNILTIWNHSAKHKELNAHRANKILKVQIQLQRLGMVKEAYDFNMESSKFVLELYKPEDVEYWQMEFSVALAFREKGHYESALQKLTSLHSKFKELRGAEDELTLAAGYRIATVLSDLEIFEESLEWAKRILQSRIRINNGEKNEDVMKTKRLVAMALEHLRRTTEALEIFKEVLEWREANLTANHKSILATRHNIATCFYSVGRFAEALAIFQEILPHQVEICGSDHPDTFTTKAWLADTLFEMGEVDQSLKISEEVLVASEKVLGAEHPQAILARDKLTLLRKLNETRNALD